MTNGARLKYYTQMHTYIAHAFVRECSWLNAVNFFFQSYADEGVPRVYECIECAFLQDVQYIFTAHLSSAASLNLLTESK